MELYCKLQESYKSENIFVPQQVDHGLKMKLHLPWNSRQTNNINIKTLYQLIGG